MSHAYATLDSAGGTHPSPQLRDLIATARRITADVVAPEAEAEDAEARWPARAMRALADAGLMGLTVPREAGGLGQGLSGLVSVAETLAAGSGATALCYAMHCVGSAVIAAKATDDQKRRYLEPIVRGEHITTLALSEPGSGAHFYFPQTSLERLDGEFVVNGTKSFVTNGGHADSYVVSTAASGAGEGVFSCLVVDAGTPGLVWQDGWEGFGMRGNSSRTVRLENARVPVPNLLGHEGDQLWYVFEVVAPYFLMAMAGTYVGVASAAYEIARTHLATRRHAHTGELLGNAPIPAWHLGELWMDLQRTRELVHAAAARADAGDPQSLPGVLAAKAAAGDTAVRLTNDAMTLCGGIAYRDNSTLARLLRDARASHVMAPTTDMLKTWLGRALIGLPLL